MMLDFYSNSNDNSYFIAEPILFRFEIYKMYLDETHDIYMMYSSLQKKQIYRMSGGIQYGAVFAKDYDTLNEAKEAAEKLYTALALDMIRNLNITMP